MTLQKWIEDRAIHGFPTFSVEDVRAADLCSSEQILQKQGNSVSTWKVAYLPNGQYKSKIIATRLPLEKIKVRMKVYEIRNGKLTIHED